MILKMQRKLMEKMTVKLCQKSAKEKKNVYSKGKLINISTL